MISGNYQFTWWRPL